MAKKKVEDIKGKTADELSKDLVDLKKKQFNLRFQKSQGQLADTSLIRQARRQVARLKTAMTATKNGRHGYAINRKTGKKSRQSKSLSLRS